jgi:hypothetical protein
VVSASGVFVVFLMIVLKIYFALVAAMSEEHSCSGAISKRKHARYSLDVKLDIISCKQRGEHVIDIAHAFQMPEMAIHTILKSIQEIETKALNLLKHSKMKIACQRSDVMEVMESCLTT